MYNDTSNSFEFHQVQNPHLLYFFDFRDYFLLYIVSKEKIKIYSHVTLMIKI